jgi:hypothetical protein
MSETVTRQSMSKSQFWRIQISGLCVSVCQSKNACATKVLSPTLSLSLGVLSLYFLPPLNPLHLAVLLCAYPHTVSTRSPASAPNGSPLPRAVGGAVSARPLQSAAVAPLPACCPLHRRRTASGHTYTQTDAQTAHRTKGVAGRAVVEGGRGGLGRCWRGHRRGCLQLGRRHGDLTLAAAPPVPRSCTPRQALRLAPPPAPRRLHCAPDGSPSALPPAAAAAVSAGGGTGQLMSRRKADVASRCGSAAAGASHGGQGREKKTEPAQRTR